MYLRLPYSRDSLCIVRIERLMLRNVKSVESGEITFRNSRKPDGPRIVGLYGQNGSGKSTVIDILEMLQHLMSGRSVADRVAWYADVAKGAGTVECEFSIDIGDDTHIRAIYSFAIRAENHVSMSDDSTSTNRRVSVRPRICDERLSISTNVLHELERMTVVIDTARGPVFGPASKYRRLVGTGKQQLTLHGIGRYMKEGEDPCPYVDLSVVRKRAFEESRSFVFSQELYESVLEHRHVLVMSEGSDASSLDELASAVATSINALSLFARHHIHVLNSADAGNALAGTLELPVLEHDLSMPSLSVDSMRMLAESGFVTGMPIDGPAWISGFTLRMAEQMLETMNTVISQIVPGLTLSLENVEPNDERPPKTQYYMQLMSHRNDRTIPFSCESGGVKRIFSFVNFLVLMYNDPRALVAIDELDSGIFEYLLGELLSIVAAHGRGQLVFTSHNLRPLETIDRGYICFTTTNPANRYLRMANVKTTNNLRDLYYRDILLGGQKERLYEPTSNGKIELALMEIGMSNEEGER